jgi:hypothetical protein
VECETPHYCNAGDRANISAAAAAAANADTVLLFLGMNSNGNNGTGAEFGGQGSSETEAKDRYDIKLRGVQQELLEVWKTPLLGAVFCNKTIKFTKTGSGQTWGSSEERWFLAGCGRRKSAGRCRPDECRLPGAERILGAGGALRLLSWVSRETQNTAVSSPKNVPSVSIVPKETPLFFECFPYVCPEPVLVK